MFGLSGLHLAEFTVKTYQKMRSDEEVELFFKPSQRNLLIIFSSTRLHYRVKENIQTMDLSITIYKLKDRAIMQTRIIPLLRNNNTSGNSILKTLILSYGQ